MTLSCVWSIRQQPYSCPVTGWACSPARRHGSIWRSLILSNYLQFTTVFLWKFAPYHSMSVTSPDRSFTLRWQHLNSDSQSHSSALKSMAFRDFKSVERSFFFVRGRESISDKTRQVSLLMQVIHTEMRVRLRLDEGANRRRWQRWKKRWQEFAAVLKHFNWLAALTAIAAQWGFK